MNAGGVIPTMPALWLDTAAVDRWAGKPVPSIKFVVADLIPDLCCSLLAGDGGSGKSILLQTMATCIAAGLPFLGRAVAPGPALYVTAEDPDDVLHARQVRINQALGVTWDDLRDLYVMSMADVDFTLFSEGEPTHAEKRLAESVAAYGVRFIGIDSASIVYNDNEIDRRLVSAFVRRLNMIARKAEAAVVLIAHTSKSSDETSARMASGSTAWVNAVRAGLRLKATEDGAELTLLKANYSKTGSKIDLRWTDDGVLVAADAPGMVAAIEQDNDDKLVLAEIAARWEHPSLEPLTKTKHGGGRHVPTVMASKHGWTTRRAERAMERLDAAGAIANARKRSKDIDSHGLKPAGEI